MFILEDKNQSLSNALKISHAITLTANFKRPK